MVVTFTVLAFTSAHSATKNSMPTDGRTVYVSLLLADKRFLDREQVQLSRLFYLRNTDTDPNPNRDADSQSLVESIGDSFGVTGQYPHWRNVGFHCDS